WIPNLAEPDPYNILPIAAGIFQFIQTKMMRPAGAGKAADPQQQMMNRMTTIIMPAMMLFYGVTFPAGLVLYWTTSNLMEIVRLYFTVGRNPAPALPETSPETGKSSGGLFSFMNRSNGMTASLPTLESTTASTGRSEDRSERDGRAASRRPKRGKRHGRR
ncbi:MAG: YidC/Oxa1 family membrane protein insertase, partial [Chloroflexi bacterium]|nr:YidC/Oxa1 family membrane protein insertase [Chloroflexota bacterium]